MKVPEYTKNFDAPTEEQVGKSSHCSAQQSYCSYSDVIAALERLKKYILYTPMVRSHTFASVDIWLKLENLQRTYSFKFRGGLNAVLVRMEQCSLKGVVTASAGNHAQGVAFAARLLGIPCDIFMPQQTPSVKVEAVRKLMARVHLYGNFFEEAESAAQAFSRDSNFDFIHPFDDRNVIAGQGTIAVEMLEKLPAINTVIVPVGGGGLASGIAVTLKVLSPATSLVVVQMEGFDWLASSMDAGRPVHAKGGEVYAEGLSVRRPGNLTFKILQDAVADVIVVTPQQVKEAQQVLLQQEKILVEASGAATFAALKVNPQRWGKTVATVITGGNVTTEFY